MRFFTTWHTEAWFESPKESSPELDDRSRQDAGGLTQPAASIDIVKFGLFGVLFCFKCCEVLAFLPIHGLL